VPDLDGIELEDVNLRRSGYATSGEERATEPNSSSRVSSTGKRSWLMVATTGLGVVVRNEYVRG
jgi:hypothetical protein